MSLMECMETLQEVMEKQLGSQRGEMEGQESSINLTGKLEGSQFSDLWKEEMQSL